METKIPGTKLVLGISTESIFIGLQTYGLDWEKGEKIRLLAYSSFSSFCYCQLSKQCGRIVTDFDF